MTGVKLTEEENRIRLQRALSDLGLTGKLGDDLAATNKMRADILNVVKEQFRGDRISSTMVQAAGGLLKDIDEQHLKREKLDVDRSNGDAAILIAQAAAAFLAGGNPYLATNPVSGDIEPQDTSEVDADIPDIDLVEDHTFIGVQTLDYDNFSAESDEDDEDDDD